MCTLYKDIALGSIVSSKVIVSQFVGTYTTSPSTICLLLSRLMFTIGRNDSIFSEISSMGISLSMLADPVI